jgi:hypothetical protein
MNDIQGFFAVLPLYATFVRAVCSSAAAMLIIALMFLFAAGYYWLKAQ